MSKNEKEAKIAALKIKINYYKAVLNFKQATFKNINNFAKEIIKYFIKSEYKAWQGLAEGVEQEDWDAIATTVYYADPSNTILGPAYFIVKNLMAITKQLEFGDTDLIVNTHLTEPSEKEIIRFLTDGKFSWSRLGVREIYYRNLEMEADVQVPIDRANRRPDLYLEDQIQNLIEDMQQIQLMR
jgi:hypothetical protein